MRMCKEASKKLKIAFVHPDLGIGGAERLVLDVAGALKGDHEVFFITNHYDETHAFEELKAKQYPVVVLGDWLPRSVLGRCQAFCAYIRMVYLILAYLLFMKKSEKVDLFFVDLIPIAIPFLKWTSQKVIYYCHHPDLLASDPEGWLKRLYRMPIDWLELKATGQADVILVNSQYTAQVFRNTFPTIQKPLKIVYPTIANSLFETLQRTTSTPIHELLPEIPYNKHGNIVFLSINRFHPAKKLDLAIHAMEELKTRCSSDDWGRVYLILAGGYDPESSANAKYYSELMQLVNSKNLGEKVIFIKSPPDTFKAELLLSCTCLIYTPVNEHFGIVPLEAMAACKPVIACNSGGPRETVDHGTTGYLCDPTPSSIAEFMHKVIHDDIVRMGLEGKRRLQRNFSYDHFVSIIKDVVSNF